MNGYPGTGSVETVTPTLTANQSEDRRASAEDCSLVPAFLRIAEIAALDANWDGEGADAPSAHAIALANVLIEDVAERYERIAGTRCAPLTSSPINNGGIQVEWRRGADRIEVEIAPDGVFSVLVISRADHATDYRENPEASLSAAVDDTVRFLAR